MIGIRARMDYCENPVNSPFEGAAQACPKAATMILGSGPQTEPLEGWHLMGSICCLPPTPAKPCLALESIDAGDRLYSDAARGGHWPAADSSRQPGVP